jgi:threonine dehydratase
VSPASGGGLISGIASRLKSVRPGCEVYGAQPELGGAIVKSLQAGHRVKTGKVTSIADALVAAQPGARTFPLIQKYCDGFELVTDAEIVAAMRALYDELGFVVEPGGAVSVAAVMSGRVKPKAGEVVCILSGGNVERERFNSWMKPV